MSILGALEKYEKMLQDPKNRTSSSGTIHQPRPAEAGANAPVDEGLTPADTSLFAEVDARMAKRLNNENVPGDVVSESRFQKVEKDISELKDLMMKIMTTHMELLEKK